MSIKAIIENILGWIGRLKHPYDKLAHVGLGFVLTGVYLLANYCVLAPGWGGTYHIPLLVSLLLASLDSLIGCVIVELTQAESFGRWLEDSWYDICADIIGILLFIVMTLSF